MSQLPARLGLSDLATAARGSGVVSALEVIVYQGQRQLRHSVARVIETHLGAVDLLVAYEGIDLSPLRMSLERGQIEPLHKALDAARFSRLRDQPGLSSDESPLWLVQRATGAHLHGIILAPNKPEPPFSRIVNAIDACLPAALRELPLR
ncbi:MAG: hypothetical protein OXG92_09300 [Chloroflexi bacterium]|nr:hypothetical protein [Chloroflexota bacterium]MCY3581236.1 hypothetical protein [Chloroflexota bacterium]MCY3716643.1 hypothetical protein [Chloroflexota bacterium]MDE2651696.1 hypothetical protein [Chloroflexota bacterium]MXV93312.1 hypothetical protein [Chloroflexota bacterium]